MTRPLTVRRAALASTMALAVTALLACSADSLQAHEWPSPRLGAEHAHYGPAQGLPPGAWSGMLWAGSEAGAPAAPNARHCTRAPQAFEIDAGPAWDAPQQGRLSRTGDSAPRERKPESPAVLGKSAAAAAMADRLRAPAPAQARPENAAASAGPQRWPLTRPVDEPVAAGVVDDNADFGAYLAYLERGARLPVHARDVHERYGLTVHDARGRPVPDAAVTVFAGSQALPLWARTDASGHAWLHPLAAVPGLGASLLEVQVRDGHSGARGSALLQRGQKHQLQVTLADAARREPPRPQLDIAFLVDATGSMGDEIDKLKRSMRAVADQIAQLPSQPDVCYGLVAYRDRGDAFFVRGADFSNDLSAFQYQLAQLHATGGGDMPEALNEALHTAVHRLSWRGDGTARMLVLVADAPPHLDYGAPYYDQDMQGALAKGIKLFAVGASGLDPVGEYVFRQAAQYTGGRFVFLTYADAHDPSSGPGRETTHDVRNYSVETLDALIVRLVREEMVAWPKA